ncbi:HDIG domain-containing protein, partial [Microgenomates group bacterium]|nr:HDIG domain-containing protein [Microgenomates group bacterium]
LPENSAKKKTRQNHNFEITTFRSRELYEQDARHPSSFSWGKTIEEDLQRRDFTINALALVADKKVDDKYTIIDKYQGQEDLAKMLIRTVGEAKVRFGEDALRMLRAIRLSVELNFSIEEKTWAALAENIDLLADISSERIRDELLKMLASDYPAAAIELLDQAGALKYIMPELLEGKGVGQSGHHTTDVWAHALDSLHYCPSSDPIVRLATLLHDIGKPATKQYSQGQWTFYNHQIVGAKMARKIGRRLHLTKEECERLYNLVRHHMFYYQPHDTDAAIRRFMRQAGLENLDDLLSLREGDRLGSGARATSWRLEEMKERMIEQLHQPFDVRDLAVDGHDLMKEFGLKPSKILGEMLNFLLEQVLDDSSLNQRDKLLSLANGYLLENSPK